jgi:hypothetical protein
MSIKSITPAMFAPELEDITHACDHCGSELVRTVKGSRRTAPPAVNNSETRAA